MGLPLPPFLLFTYAYVRRWVGVDLAAGIQDRDPPMCNFTLLNRF